MRLGPGDQRGAAGQIPFAPRGDDGDVGVERIGGKLEANLIVALAGGAMGDRIGAGLVRDLDQPLGDQRTGDAGAKQIVAFIAGVGAHHREDEIGHELLAQVLDEDVGVGDPHRPGLVARRLDFLALAEIGGECHHLAAALDAQPFCDHRGVEPARIGKDDFTGGRGAGHEREFLKYRPAMQARGVRAPRYQRSARRAIRAACTGHAKHLRGSSAAM